MTGDRVRLLHLVQSMNYGGMERVIADLITHTDPARFELHLLCLEYLGRFSDGLDKSARLHVAPPMPRLSFLNPSELAKQIGAIAPEIVHTHSGVWYKGSLAAKKAGVRALVHTEHGRRSPDPFGDRLFDALAARRTDVVVAVSARLATDLPHVLRMPASKVVCIPNGVDTDLFRPRPDSSKLRHELGLGANTTIIGSIGRLEPIKRYEGMLAAFAEFAATDAGRDAHLVIGGEGTTRAELERQASRLGITARTHFLGWRDDIHDLLSSFALFTMSSQSEGTSISLLEAMSAGVPPVVTDVGGNRAVLGDDLALGLVPFGDARALADAWADTLRSAAQRAKRSELARQRVVGGFSAAAVAAEYEKVYLQLSRP